MENTLGALLWQGGWVSMTKHIAMRSTSMIILLRYLDLRFGSEKSISEKDQDLLAGLG
jgi:hypothetical protein